MRPWPKLCPFLVLAGMALSSGAWAAPTIHCVASPAELLTELEQASQGGVDELRIVAGVYPMPKDFGLDLPIYADFRISGGWDKSCLHQTPNSLLTILEPEPGADPIGATFTTIGQGEIRIDTLTFQDMKHGVVVTLGDEDSFFSLTSQVLNCAFLRDGSVRIERPDGPHCGLAMRVDFRNNLVADSQDPTFATELTVCSRDGVYVVHNTFANNPGRALGVYGPTDVSVANNVFSHNVRNFAWDFFPDEGHPYFCGNVGDDFSEPEASHGLDIQCTVAHNWATDPQLDATFVPLPNSPAIDFGRTPEQLSPHFVYFPDFDLVGGQRFVGSRPDAGAFEVPDRCSR